MKISDEHDDRTASETSTQDAEKAARRRVAQMKEFYTHLAVFLVAHVAMIGIYLLSGGGHFWPLYSFFGWGIGLGAHAAATFPMYGRNWEERKVREIMLQQEHGLNADEVRDLLREEMRAERKVQPSAAELRRLQERIENLEAIVTSRDWDDLPSHSGLLRHEDPVEDVLEDSLETPLRVPPPVGDPSAILPDDADEGPSSEELAERAARLARRVR